MPTRWSRARRSTSGRTCSPTSTAGRSRGIYRADRWHDLRGLPAIDWWSLPLLKHDAFRSSWLYRMYFFWPVFFSRGCPHPCEYCAVQTYYNRSYRTRPVDDVIDDVRQLAGSARAGSSSSTTTRSRDPRRRRSSSGV